MLRVIRQLLLEARITFAELSPSEKVAKVLLWLLILSLSIFFVSLVGVLVYLSILITPRFWGVWVFWLIAPITIWALEKSITK